MYTNSAEAHSDDKVSGIEKEILDHVTDEAKKSIFVLPKSNKTVLKALYEGEDGDAYLLIKALKDRYVYDHMSCEWYYWNDHHWRLDSLGQVVHMIKEVIQMYGEQNIFETLSYKAADDGGEGVKAATHLKNSKALLKRISDLRTLKRKSSVLKLARSGVKALGIVGDEWDKNKMLLGCKNGVWDLASGKFHPGKPSDYIKLISKVSISGENAPRDKWEKFLLQVYGGDEEMVSYIQRLLGYGITGLNIEHVFPILWGPRGRNGKTTILEILKYILGDLAFKVPSDFIMDNRFKGSGTGPDSVTTGMQGKRLVWFSETNDKQRFNISKLKEFSGGDTQSGRVAYEKRNKEFQLEALCLTLTNKRPIVPPNDPALWERIHLIPHDNSFVSLPDENDKHQFQANKNILAELKEQAAGILVWLVEGCLDWQEHGLNPPEKVLIATKNYHESQDIFGHFVGDCCVITETAKEKPKNIYTKYKAWCDETGHKPMAKNRVMAEMTDRFGGKVKIAGDYYFKGVTTFDSF